MMVMSNKKFIIILLFLIILIATQTTLATNIPEKLDPIRSNGAVLVRSLALADSLEAELKWLGDINTLNITKEDKTVKMMVESPYIQINSTTIRTESPMVIKDNNTYIPFTGIMNVFGFLIEYDKISNSYYLFKPQSFLKEVTWGPNRQSLVLKMDNIAPYRLKLTDDPKKLIVEIEKAALEADFKDNVSDKNYYFTNKRIENQATLQLVITSKYPLPINSDEVISEENGNLLIRFMPQITSINWQKEGSLEIQANGSVNKPEVSFLEEPRRMVLDIPDLLLSEFEKNLDENEWIKDVRVSQFQFEPTILRIVLDLEEEKYLNIVQQQDSKKIVLKPVQRARIFDLKYEDHQIVFKTDAPVEPDLFTLEDPARLVINLFNTYREDNMQDEVDIKENLVERIRVGRFDSQVVRIVADLSEITDYEVKKFSFPHRVVVDINGKEITPEEIDLPEPMGIVKEMRMSRFELDDEEVTRIVFELSEYFNHNVISDNPDSKINIALAKAEILSENNLIVIDAGQGGFDPGAVSKHDVQEKVVNLQIVQKLANILRSQGFKVLLTREDDSFVSLNKRVEIANEKGARIFISIHNNSSTKNTSEGTETFIAPNKSGDSLLLAQKIQEELIRELCLVDRGVKKEHLYVIKYTKMPAVLIEVAFLSNPTEEKLLKNKEFITNSAIAISRGIVDYFDKFKD